MGNRGISSFGQAVAHFEDALAFCRRAGYRPELAWTCCDLSDALTQRDSPGESSKALALLKESLSISTELGMQPLTERVSDRLDRVQAQSSRVPAYPAGLTVREVDVLLLIAQGKTTREIAGELVISPRTVQRHTTNLYAKINARNRAEATAFALNELATPDKTSSSQ